jgi:hypothetical protein
MSCIGASSLQGEGAGRGYSNTSKNRLQSEGSKTFSTVLVPVLHGSDW